MLQVIGVIHMEQLDDVNIGINFIFFLETAVDVDVKKLRKRFIKQTQDTRIKYARAQEMQRKKFEVRKHYTLKLLSLCLRHSSSFVKTIFLDCKEGTTCSI